jgi:hypothetical protein
MNIRLFICIVLIFPGGLVADQEKGMYARHALAIGDSVDRLIGEDFCEAVEGDLQKWGEDWHKYTVSAGPHGPMHHDPCMMTS